MGVFRRRAAVFGSSMRTTLPPPRVRCISSAIARSGADLAVAAREEHAPLEELELGVEGADQLAEALDDRGTIRWQAVRTCSVMSNSVGLPSTGSSVVIDSVLTSTVLCRSLIAFTICLVN